VNAARVACQLGGCATLVTIIPDAGEHLLIDGLRREGISFKSVRSRGQVRVATILHESEGRMSALNEAGASLDIREWEEFTRIVRGGLVGGCVLLCSGSVPPGAPADGYARLAREARHVGSRCIVDAAGATLAATLDAGEGLVIPNLAEAEGILYGPRAEPLHPEDAPERAREAAAGLLRLGAHAAVVTAGGEGVAYAERGPRGSRGWVAAPEIVAHSPIGAGDAFAAGLSLRFEARAELKQAARFAVAVAAAHVESRDGRVELQRVKELLWSRRASRRIAQP
jgi:fructose-1-phosphate kinase PfkB-like protein